MSIYDRQRGGRPINPAVALYKHWHTVLTGHPRTKRNDKDELHGRVHWGTGYGYSVSFHHSHGVNEQSNTSDRPPILYSGMVLNADGTFRLGSYHGWQQRDNIAQNTFVRWGHVHGEYVWYVDTGGDQGAYEGSYRSVNLKDWHEQVPYIAEKVAGGDGYRRPGPLLRLQWDGKFEAWTIAFHKTIPGHSTYQQPITQKDFDYYVALRNKRYQRYEREHLLQTGVLKRDASRRIYSPEEVRQRHEEAVQVIVAHMDVGMAARTIPLRKNNTEEVGLWEPSGCQ